MKYCEIVDSFMTQFSVVNQLRQYGKNLSNKRVIEKVLKSLSKKFEGIVVSTEEFKDTSQMKIEELSG